MTHIFDPIRWVREIHVIGAGGIGSWLGLFLMKNEVPEVHFYDDDVVEEHNLYTQFYWPEDLGVPKVEALARFAKRMNLTTKIVPHVMRVEKDSDLNFSGVVMSGVDSMDSRINDIWPHLKFNTDVDLYMDGRIGGDTFHLYALNPSVPDQVRLYEAWPYPGSVAGDAPCSIRSDFHSALALNGHMLKSLTSFARGKRPAEILHGDLAVVAVPGGATPVVQIP